MPRLMVHTVEVADVGLTWMWCLHGQQCAAMLCASASPMPVSQAFGALMGSQPGIHEGS